MESHPEINDLEAHVGYWLRYVSNHVSGAFQQNLTSSGVTVAEWVALRKLYRLGRTSPSVLADTLGMTRGAVSKLLDRLVNKKLVDRQGAEHDKRCQEIELTASGRNLVPTLARIADQNDEVFFSHLSPAQREMLISLLKETVRVHHLREIPLS